MPSESQMLNELAVMTSQIFNRFDTLSVLGKEAHVFVEIKQQLAQLNNALVQIRDAKAKIELAAANKCASKEPCVNGQVEDNNVEVSSVQ